MTPREFLRRFRTESYNEDPRLVTGRFFSASTLDVASGDTVGVVLMNLGGPDGEEAVEPFLYNLFMDPALVDIPVGGLLRHWVSTWIAWRRSKSVAEDYKRIDEEGGSPINPLTREQSEHLEATLNERYGAPSGVAFKTYVAMRYWTPSSETAAAQMEDDGVDAVVLLPLYPQYSKTTSGASLVYWHELEKAGEIPDWPTSFVYEYAANPKYLEALSDRIDEGLQRFPEAVRDDVHLLFSAHGTPLKEMKERRDPYCCLVHSTVQRLMEHRGHDRSFNTAFQSKVGLSEWLTPATRDEVERLAEAGEEAILVVPVAFVTDHVETSYELALEIPGELEEEGAALPDHYEVMPGLNSHPTFIDALADVTAGQLELPGTDTPAPWSAHSRYKASDRAVRCHQCERIAEATDWSRASKSTLPE